MIENDIVTLKIEKMSNLGFGIAHQDGLVVFVEGACTEDEVKVKLSKVKKNYAEGKVVEVITPSQYRVEPFCAMQKVCGACQFGHIDYDYQLKIKKEIIEDAMRTIGNVTTPVQDVVPSPENKAYRHKVQYPIAQTKVSKRLLAGYYKPKSHEIVNIKHCPIQPAICDEIIDYIRVKSFDFAITGYNEKKHSGDLRHVVIRTSASNDKTIVILVVNATKSFEKLRLFAEDIQKNFENVIGVCANYNSKQTNVIMSDNTECLVGKDFIKERILDKTFRIGANTFFQINPKSAENIFKYVKDKIAENFENPLVLDAYSGVSSFGITVADIAKKVVCIEEVKESVEKAREIAEANEVVNVEFHTGEASKFFEKEKRKFDVTILDPPRKGCSEQSLEQALRVTKNKIIYVSCNPATLARDLKYLTSKGATVESLQPFDMFCHTYHVETVAVVDISSCFK